MLDESSVTLYKGDTKEIGTKLSPIDTTDKVVWSSSNSNIASVGDSGVITAVSPGENNNNCKSRKWKSSVSGNSKTKSEQFLYCRSGRQNIYRKFDRTGYKSY